MANRRYTPLRRPVTGAAVLERMTPTDASSILPPGKRFAFTVVDDTDHATVDRIGPVYRLLEEIGMRTTKTVWTVPATEPSPYEGSSTAADPRYREFCRELQTAGFELALHGVTMHSSTRPQIEQGLGDFAEWFGQMPRMHINHFQNADNLYWGLARLGGRFHRAIYRVASRQPASAGHVADSPHFWGDLAQQHIDYVRSFTYRETNLLRLGVPLVYKDPQRPYANRMFISTEGGTLETFLDAVSEDRQDELAAEGGICIMYTHFGAGFAEHGQLDKRFERLMRRLAALDGWFVPASELLDALCESDCPAIGNRQRNKLERRWIAERLRHGAS